MTALWTLLLAAGLSFAGDETAVRRYYYEEIRSPFFALDVEAGLWRSARPGALPSSFPARKEPGALRIFVVGGTSAAGYAGPLDLEAALRRALPGRKLEVINCGMRGYDSYRQGLVLGEAAKHSPDAVVFLTGHDDYAFGRADDAPSPLAVKASSFARKLGWSRESGRDSREKLDAALARRFAANIAAAKSAGAAVVAVLPPPNCAAAPDLPYPWNDQGYLEGLRALIAGRAAEAAKAWTKALASAGPASRAHLLHELSLRASARGDLAAAEELSEKAQESAPVCGPSCRALLKRTAEEGGAAVADASAAFHAVSRGSPGFDLFLDDMQWQPESSGLVSAAAVKAMRAHPAFSSWGWNDAALAALESQARAAAGPSAAKRRREREHRLYRAGGKMSSYWVDPQTAALLEKLIPSEPALASAEGLLAAWDTAAKAQPRPAGLPEYRRPTGAAVRRALALALLRLRRTAEAHTLLVGDLGDEAAILRELAGGKAAPLAPVAPPEPVPVRSGGERLRRVLGEKAVLLLPELGLAYMSRWHAGHPEEFGPAQLRDWLSLVKRAGPTKSSRKALAVLDSLPLAEEDWGEIGRCWALAGEPGRAAAWLQRAAARRPREAMLRHDLGLALHNSGDKKAALAQLKLAAELGPEDPRHWLSLGTALEQAGDRAAAAKAFRSGVERAGETGFKGLLEGSLRRVEAGQN